MYKIIISNLPDKICSISVACTLALFGMVLLMLCTPQSAQAATPGHTTTMLAGAYTIDVTLSQDPPFTDQPFTVTVTAHNRASLLSGQVIAQPGLGTDGANVYSTLHMLSGHPGVLQTTLRIPVRGAWHIVVEINGTRGQGTGSVDVVAAAPGARPVWLAWSIGALPALGLLFWTLRQRNFRRALLSSDCSHKTTPNSTMLSPHVFPFCDETERIEEQA